VTLPQTLSLDHFDALLLDLDGTLVDSSAAVRRAWEAFAARNGLDAEQVIAFAQGRPSSESVALLIPDGDHELESRLIEDAEVNDTDGLIAIAGARELLSSGLTMAVVTSCSQALAAVRLQGAGLQAPDVLVSCDDVAAGKPDPECFLLAAQLLRVSPERCLVAEDSPAGIRAARAAGASVLGLRTTHRDDELLEADAVADDLTELAAAAAWRAATTKPQTPH
jgi:sugar-phosphatase